MGEGDGGSRRLRQRVKAAIARRTFRGKLTANATAVSRISTDQRDIMSRRAHPITCARRTRPVKFRATGSDRRVGKVRLALSSAPHPCNGYNSVSLDFVIRPRRRRQQQDSQESPPTHPRQQMPRLSRSVLPSPRRGCSQIIRYFSPARSNALFISLSGSVINLILAFKCYSFWSSFKGTEPDSEWEGTLDSWSGESLTLLWGLLSCYFAAEAVSSLVGFIGIVKVRVAPLAS